MEKGRATKVGPFTQTVKAQYADPGGNDCFVPGWDESPGAGQSMDHVQPRRRMRQKMTPRGAGKLIPKG